MLQILSIDIKYASCWIFGGIFFNIYDILNEEDFNNQAHRWIIKEILKYYDKYHTVPSLDILKVEIKKIENEVLQISVQEQLREAYIASDEDLEYVQEEFSAFCKNQQLKIITDRPRSPTPSSTNKSLSYEKIKN